MFIDEVIRVGREELSQECDYVLERKNQERFRELVSGDPELVRLGVSVPQTFPKLSTANVLTTEFARGTTIDGCVDLPQNVRDDIGRAVLRLTMLELFDWRFMQTDPNWGNFLYDRSSSTLHLIDFGAAREFDENFTKNYLEIVMAAANKDVKKMMSKSIEMGFLDGKENDIMLNAHESAGLVLGEPFLTDEPYDFKEGKITTRIAEHFKTFTLYRRVPPPPEVYTLHRKLAGCFLLCVKLGARVRCRDVLMEVWGGGEE